MSSWNVANENNHTVTIVTRWERAYNAPPALHKHTHTHTLTSTHSHVHAGEFAWLSDSFREKTIWNHQSNHFKKLKSKWLMWLKWLEWSQLKYLGKLTFLVLAKFAKLISKWKFRDRSKWEKILSLFQFRPDHGRSHPLN